MTTTVQSVSKLISSPQTAQAAIDAKHNQLKGDAGLLGIAIEGLGKCPDGVGFFQRFKNGMIYWTPATVAFEVHGSILAKWASMGYEKCLLGYPISDESGTPDGVGRFNRFQNGMIYWTPATGAFEVHGSILAKWASMGYEKCLLGYPISDESSTPDGVGRFNRFQNGMIYWTPKTGAFEVHGSILAKWSSIGYEKSPLGYPISDESAAIENGRMSTFEHGQIYYWGNIGAIVNMGAPLSSKSAITVHLSGPIIFPDGVAITSAYNIAITPAGDISASIHAHCSSEVVTYDYGVVILLTTPNGLTVGVQHSGHVSNPIIGSANNDDWTANRNEPIISRNYSQFMQASVAHISKTADTEIFGQSLNDLLQQALQAAGKAAVTFLLA